MSERPSWDEYFMGIAQMVATRSTCLRRSVGAIAVNNKRILATGYNGPPKGLRHCSEAGCIRQEMGIPSGQRHELCRGLHAEQNCIIQAAVHGVQLEGSTIYCTTQPCSVCAKMLINAGISEIVFAGGYPDEMSVSMLDEAGVKLRGME
jgi:dCMP deaminase